MVVFIINDFVKTITSEWRDYGLQEKLLTKFILKRYFETNVER